MTALLTGLVTLLVFGSVILVHELGHFLAARHCGIHVEEFSIGFGPKIFQRRRGSTTYTLRLFPLGGYNLFSPLPEDNEDADAEETAAFYRNAERCDDELCAGLCGVAGAGYYKR